MYKHLINSVAARRRTSLIVAAVLFLPFLFFFSAGSLPSGPGGIAGKIFGKPVPWEAFETQRRWLRRQLQDSFQGLPAAILEPWLEQQTWDRLVVLAETRRRHLRVSDAEVAIAIREMPALQDQGRFVPDRYDRYLRFLGSTPRTFEAMIRDQLAMDKLVRSVREAATPTEDEVRTAILEDQERMQATAFVFEAAPRREAAAAGLTEELVRARYDAHPEDVRTPERITIEYVGLTRPEAAAGVSPAEEELRAYYAAHQEAFEDEHQTPKPFDQVAEEVRGRLIEQRAGRRLAAFSADLEDALKQGWRLEELAGARELAVRTAGPLAVDQAWQGQTDPELLRALAGLGEGRLSAVIETGSGAYVGRVTQRIPAQVPPFDQVQVQVRERVLAERAQDAARADAQAFRTRVQDRMAAGWRMPEALLLEPIVGTPVTCTRAQAIDPLGVSAPEATRAAFTIPLGTLTDAAPIETGVIVLLPEQRVAPDPAVVASALERDRSNIVARKQTEALQRWLEEVRTQAKIERTSPPSS